MSTGFTIVHVNRGRLFEVLRTSSSYKVIIISNYKNKYQQKEQLKQLSNIIEVKNLSSTG